MINLKFLQDGHVSLGCTLEINGNQIAAQELEIVAKAGELTKIKLVGSLSNAEIEMKNLLPENLMLDGILYQKVSNNESILHTKE